MYIHVYQIYHKIKIKRIKRLRDVHLLTVIPTGWRKFIFATRTMRFSHYSQLYDAKADYLLRGYICIENIGQVFR